MQGCPHDTVAFVSAFTPRQNYGGPQFPLLQFLIEVQSLQ
jgi:hypothetical protein